LDSQISPEVNETTGHQISRPKFGPDKFGPGLLLFVSGASLFLEKLQLTFSEMTPEVNETTGKQISRPKFGPDKFGPGLLLFVSGASLFGKNTTHLFGNDTRG
jgi:hypothetical protein